jgi:hypothetical protein
MNFNSNSDQQDIVSEVLKICKATTGKYPLKDIARRVNAGLDRYFHIGFMATGDVSLGDQNNSVTPLYQQSLSSGINAYAVAITGSYNGVLKFEALDSSGNSSVLEEENLMELDFGQEYSTAVTGVPSHFVRVGGTYYVRPTPNYTKANGLTAFANNRPSYFASTDTTKSPGIPTQFHMFLARFAAQPYLQENNMDNVQSNAQDIFRDEREIKDYFLRTNRGARGRMSGANESNR